jgi:hypothetical protein
VGIGLTCTGTVPRGRVGSMGRTSADLTLRAARAGVYSIGAHVSVMGDANAANDSGVVSLVVRPPPRTSP